MIIYNKETPVLFLIFNRLGTALEVFSKIKNAEPKRLYIAADGWRNEIEKTTCENVRNSILAQVDWDCSVKTLFRDINIGCRKAVSSAISWFFENEPEGIILEDDCLPADNFFGFCSQLLERYRHDERVGHISGSNDQKGTKRGDGSYYFSTLTGVWGWAGWRRVWKDYDINMNSYPLFEKLNYLEKMPGHAPFKQYWSYKFKSHYYDKKLDSWDFQYAYLNLVNNRLSINPNVNLTSNIGCISPEASHFDANNPAANRSLEEIEDLQAPMFIVPDIAADIYAQNFEFSLPILKENSMDGFLFIKEKLIECTDNIRKNKKDIKIPKIIHQIWDSHDELTSSLKEISKTWKEFHPDWEYRLWNKTGIDEFLNIHFPDFIPYYKSYPYDIQRWFAIRYLILFHYGGLYVDLDYECIEPVDALLSNSKCCMSIVPAVDTMNYNKPVVVGNSFMACIAKHNFFEKIIYDMKINNNKTFSKFKTFEIMERTGPFLTTRVHCAYPDKEEITLIPTELVTPLTINESHMLIKGHGTREIEDKIERAFTFCYHLNLYEWP